MLSRTADNLYWVARYVERAEFLARILDATARIATLPAAYGGQGSEWESALLTAGAADGFFRVYQDINEKTVTDYLVFHPDNPSSIRNCLAIARNNARAVRTAVTGEMWETINSAWLELRKVEPSSLGREELARFLDWVKNVSLTFDGSAYRTMLRNDAYWFTRLGACIERADNTARILDVKYHVLLPETEDVGGSLDYFQWATILRGVSALTSYHWVYRQSVKPWLVADLLILNRQMPRSLISSYETIVRFLDALGEAYGKVGQPHRIARNTLNALDTTVIDDVFQQGLHEFVTGFITDNNRLGKAIADHYLT
jgi:uncharacterized alpha-E superfamily protein